MKNAVIGTIYICLNQFANSRLATSCAIPCLRISRAYIFQEPLSRMQQRAHKSSRISSRCYARGDRAFT